VITELNDLGTLQLEGEVACGPAENSERVAGLAMSRFRWLLGSQRLRTTFWGARNTTVVLGSHWSTTSVTSDQGLTLVHFSAQLERFLWDRDARRDCVARVKGC
jgi:hypothetical protein